MHFELGHQVYDPTERLQPLVASVGSRITSRRSRSIKRCRSASNPARSMERYASHFPSGENRGVLSAPGLRVNVTSGPSPLGTSARSTFVLSATVLSA